jgi:hypothetical protein
VVFCGLLARWAFRPSLACVLVCLNARARVGWWWAWPLRLPPSGLTPLFLLLPLCGSVFLVSVHLLELTIHVQVWHFCNTSRKKKDSSPTLVLALAFWKSARSGPCTHMRQKPKSRTRAMGGESYSPPIATLQQFEKSYPLHTPHAATQQRRAVPLRSPLLSFFLEVTLLPPALVVPCRLQFKELKIIAYYLDVRKQLRSLKDQVSAYMPNLHTRARARPQRCGYSL